MYKYLFCLSIHFCLFPLFRSYGQTIDYLPEDSITIVRLLTNVLPSDTISPMIRFGEKFCDTPYIASTLEKSTDEHLIINFREMDCTTFVENTLALARTYSEKKTGFSDFTHHLQFLRYQNGRIEGYPSRLHYFSDWITDNSRKGIVKEITPALQAVRIAKKYDYMSRNSNKYPALRQNPSAIKKIKEKEMLLSRQSFYYLPKDSLTETRLQKINNGDIIAITTDIKGLDIVHVGIACKKEGIVYLLHASQNKGKVILDPTPLTEYLKPHPRQTGIRVIRPLLK